MNIGSHPAEDRIELFLVTGFALYQFFHKLLRISFGTLFKGHFGGVGQDVRICGCLAEQEDNRKQEYTKDHHSAQPLLMRCFLQLLQNPLSSFV